MRFFFQDIDINCIEGFSVVDIHSTDLPKPMCQWRGITCTNDEFTDVFYNSFDCGNFRIGFLPKSVDYIEIQKSHQKFQLDTRVLSPKLTFINMSSNSLYGRLDLAFLPCRLEYCYFAKNQLRGPISLVSIPPDMTRLWIYGNPINQNVVYYSSSLCAGVNIRLPKRFGPHGVKGVKPIDGSDNDDGEVQIKYW